nr:restriction endonuclease subunit S [uncultured Flavobacterium sp.]
MQKYDQYKNSGVEWLGEIPAHWELSRLGTLLNPISTNNRTDLPLLSITREKGVILRDLDNEEENHNFIPDDLSNYKMVRKGQFGMNKMKAWQGSYGISDYDGIVSPAYFIFDVNSKIEPKYFHAAIRSKLYISFFGSASDGVRIGQWDLSKPRMKQIPFLIPPKKEQIEIANFLDDKTTKIGQAITLKQKQIELLKERRQILIHKAVTRGLNNDVKLKDSSVEWIGKIPEHWEVKNLRFVFQFLNNKRIPLSAIEREKMQGEFPYYGASGIIDYVDNYIFDEKLILIGEDGANLLSKSTPLAFVADGKYWVNNHAHILRPIYEGFNYWAEQLSLIDYTVFISGAAQPKLSRGNLSAVKVIVPSLNDLKDISIYIDSISLKIATAISLKEQEIEKLKEYKMSLIDGVVTGKILINK